MHTGPFNSLTRRDHVMLAPAPPWKLSRSRADAGCSPSVVRHTLRPSAVRVWSRYFQTFLDSPPAPSSPPALSRRSSEFDMRAVDRDMMLSIRSAIPRYAAAPVEFPCFSSALAMSRKTSTSPLRMATFFPFESFAAASDPWFSPEFLLSESMRSTDSWGRARGAPATGAMRRTAACNTPLAGFPPYTGPYSPAPERNASAP